MIEEKSHQHEEVWESDSVCTLLGRAAPPKASARFAENTLRAARLCTQNTPWWKSWKSWKSLFAPTPLAGLGAAATLAALALAFFPNTETPPLPEEALVGHETEEIAEIENLITSVEQVDELSDSELIALIGY